MRCGCVYFAMEKGWATAICQKCGLTPDLRPDLRRHPCTNFGMGYFIHEIWCSTPQCIVNKEAILYDYSVPVYTSRTYMHQAF